MVDGVGGGNIGYGFRNFFWKWGGLGEWGG